MGREHLKAVQPRLKLGPGVAEHLQGAAIDKGEAAFEVGFVDGLREKFGELLKALLAPLRFLSFFNDHGGTFFQMRAFSRNQGTLEIPSL